ncbi:helix-turn-helix domain-containing protein [Novosphingobium sp.]|uniref:helix-turn-helix domain-containing protein n=1 Tax=Novosphingobium sp. TaxID=1874826 RepID=UPI001D8B3E69|nr:helix-turn-helix domain-containing protein [Novosphingobium sp.]MBX9662725.1 helix-turn-helix domain-containing protein [Novosphingobium sp.]
MTAVQKFATDGISPPERLAFWNALVDSVYSGTYVKSASEDFTGEMWTWQVGDLAMIRPRSTASFVGRDPRYTADERLILHLQCRGSSVHRQSGTETTLGAGDFIIASPHEAYAMDLAAHELLVVEFPRAPLAERFPGLDDALRMRMSGATPGARVFHDFLLSLWRQSQQGFVDPDWQDGVSQVFYDLIALAMRGAAKPDAASPAADSALRRRVLGIVEAQLADPALRTLSLAAACGASVRTIQNLFAGMGTTPSGYILERRLARAAERLGAAPEASITEVAFELGFNDSAYFARAFRQRFGVSPREWRRNQG